VPITFPKERWTKQEIEEAIRSNYHYTEPGDGELFITKILAALDPPKPVLLCSHLFSRDPMVVCDRKLGHLGPCAPDNGADTLKAQAELAKERP
jgi:hypothetical protein